MQIFQKLHSVTKKFLAEVVLDDLARGKIDIKSLPSSMRRYVASCLAILCIVLISTIILYFYDNLLPSIAFTIYDVNFNISYLALIISIITFIFGWTFLLMGGIWSNTITFSLLSYLFFYFFGYLGIEGTKTLWPILPLGLVFILLIPSLGYSRSILKNRDGFFGTLILCGVISYFVMRATVFGNPIPPMYRWWAILGLTVLLMCIAWFVSRFIKLRFPEEKFISIGRFITFCIIIILYTIIVRQPFELSQFADKIITVFHGISSYISLFWFILGFCALWMVINLAEWSRDALQILFPRFVIIILVSIFWAVVLLLNIEVKYFQLQLPYLWELPLMWTGWAIIGCIFLLYKKLTEERILGLFQLTIFVLLFSHAYYVSQQEVVVEEKFQLWSLAIFIITITWLLFQGSGFIINRSSKWFPRRSRLFIFFGLIFIMAGMNNVMLVTKIQKFLNEFRISAYTGFLYTGPPFILYMWLVKRLKHHPVKPVELSFLFIWGAILVHPAIALEKMLQAYGVPIYILILVMAVIQEYIKLYMAKRLIYNSPHFNEPIDGIIYISAIALGWAIFYLKPQFALLPYPISVPYVWHFTYREFISTNAAFLWHYFTIQFVCASLIGYGLARAKLFNIRYKMWPLLLGLILAVLFRGISDIILKTNINILFSYGIIWPYIILSLLIIGIIVTMALKTFRRYIRFIYVIGIGLVISTCFLFYQFKTITYKDPIHHFQSVVPRQWKEISNPPPETLILLESPHKDNPVRMSIAVGEYIKSHKITSYELQGKLVNLHGIEISYFMFFHDPNLSSNNACFILFNGQTGYSIIFTSPKSLKLDEITSIVKSFCFDSVGSKD